MGNKQYGRQRKRSSLINGIPIDLAQEQQAQWFDENMRYPQSLPRKPHLNNEEEANFGNGEAAAAEAEERKNSKPPKSNDILEGNRAWEIIPEEFNQSSSAELDSPFLHHICTDQGLIYNVKINSNQKVSEENPNRLIADYKNAETWLQLAANRILIPQFPILSLIPFLEGEGIADNSDLSYTYSQLGLIDNLISDRHSCFNRDSAIVKCMLVLPLQEIQYFLTICECYTLCIWALHNNDNEIEEAEQQNQQATIRNRKLVYSVQLPSKLRPPKNSPKVQNRILCVPMNHGKLVILSTSFSLRANTIFSTALVVMNLEAANENELFGPVCSIQDTVFPLSLYRMSREQSDVDEKGELFSLDSIISEWSDGSIRAWRFSAENPIQIDSVLPVHLDDDCLESHRIHATCSSQNKQCQYINSVKLSDNRFLSICTKGHCCLHNSITGKKIKSFQLRLQVNTEAYITRTEIRDGKTVQIQSVRDGLSALAFGQEAVHQKLEAEESGKPLRYMDIRISSAISTGSGLLLTLDPRMKTAMLWSVDSEVCLLVFPVQTSTKRFINELEPLIRDVASDQNQPASPK